MTGGGWYAGSAWARFASGAGEVFIRFSWYASSDGSGRALSTNDGLVTSSASWKTLTIGPVQAPAKARSARFRLMLRPAGNATVLFDEASMTESKAPAAAETPTPETATAATTAPASTQSPEPQDPVPDGPAPQVEARRSLELRLSEILPDAVETGNDAAYEWIELVNVGSEPIDTSGWHISDDQSSDPLPAAIIQPGEYLVVAGASAAVPDGVAVVRIEDGRIGNGLNNLGETLTLTGPGGADVDDVAYGDAGEVAAPEPGLTIGVSGTPAGKGIGEVWMLTSNATPGFPNVFPEEAAGPLIAAPTESSTGQGPEPEVASDNPSTAGQQASEPAVTEPKKSSNIPWVILIAAVGAGLGGLAVRHGPALVRLKERITRRA